jgi:hypothetical protein
MPFEILPRRWVVERTFAWLGRNRRLAKDFERTIESAIAWLYLASIPAHHTENRKLMKLMKIIMSQTLRACASARRL